MSQQTYDRMKAERLAEAELIRAGGNEEVNVAAPLPIAGVVEIVADAQKDLEILRGQGEAERNGIFADASSRDPSFYEFYRSMAAYRASFTSGGKTLVAAAEPVGILQIFR